MTLNEFYTKLKGDLKNLDTIYKGFVLTELSIPNFERNKKSVYNNCIYVDASNSKQTVKLLINLSILNEAINNGHTINESVSVDVTIDTISLDTKSTVLIKISKIVESGIGEQEIFTKGLTAYCNENDLFNRHKKPYPSVIKKIALISTNNTNTLDDIMKNLDYTKEVSSFKVQSISNAIAEQIQICNNEDYDLILLYRGGHEDKAMNIYSDIPVLEAINNSSIHIGIALGHEVDTPFVYKIADSTYSTPTNFAQVINNYNQAAIDEFDANVFWIKNNIESIKTKLESNLANLNFDNIIPFVNKAQSNLNLCNEKISNHLNKFIHSYELDTKGIYSNIKSSSLFISDKLQEDLTLRANKINTIANELTVRYNEKKSKKTKLILIGTIIVAILIIAYLVFK